MTERTAEEIKSAVLEHYGGRARQQLRRLLNRLDAVVTELQQMIRGDPGRRVGEWSR